MIDMNTHDKENVDRFFSTITPWEEAYSHIGFSYFAVRKDGAINLLQGRLFLHTAPSAIPHTQFETARVLVGYFPLSELGVSLHEFVVQLTETGEINTPIGKLVFPIEKDRGASAYFNAFHQEGIASGNRLPVLTLSGAQQNSYIEQPDIDWELKAASQPFDSLDELLAEYLLGIYRGRDFASVEVVATNVAAINFSSIVSGEVASPSVYLAKSLDKDKCKIGFRVFLHGKVMARNSIGGNELSWAEEGHFLHGVGTVKIPTGAVLHCVASYNGFAQHQGWVADPTNFQNPRRVSLESFDEKLELLRDYLFEEQKQRKNARDFESGVASLMWMLGFSVAQAGGGSRTTDAADILATTPKGNILVVECTTGLLKAENKLAILVDRTEAVRKRLVLSGNSHLKLLPVIVTAKTKDEVKADLEQAQKLGVVVVTRESLLEALQQTIAAPDPEIIFERAWGAVQPRQDQLGLFAGKA